MNRREHVGKLAKERAGLFLGILAALLLTLASPATANTPDLSDLQINYQALAGTFSAEPPDPRFSLFKPPPFPASTYRLIKPAPILDLDIWERARGKMRIRGFDLGVWLQPQGNQQFKWEIASRAHISTYDAFDRLESTTDRYGVSLTYSYDANGNRTQLQSSDGRLTSYTYDGLNRPVTVGIAGVGSTSYQYFRDSRLKAVASPGGLASAYAYDEVGRVATIENTLNGNPVSSYQYEYDQNGNRTQQIEANEDPEVTTYTYDAADRLTSVTYPDQKVAYTLDGVGNRVEELITDPTGTTTLETKTFTYDERNQLRRIVDTIEGATEVAIDYVYDGNGNQIGKAKDGESSLYSWDARDRLAKVTVNGEVRGIYTYNYQDLRTSKLGGEGLIRYHYDDQSVLLQTNALGDELARYDYGADRLLSLYYVGDDEIPAGREWYLFDGMGSIVNTVKPGLSTTTRSKWDAWGNSRGGTGDTWNSFGYTGHEHDENTGLIYAKARFYDPDVGRFLSEDPFEGVADEPPSLHKYLYAYGNPTFYTDPTGQCVMDLPCPEIAKDALYTASAILDAQNQTQEQMFDLFGKGAFNGAVDTLDFATLGSISDTKARVGTFFGTEGTLTERSNAASAAGNKARAEKLSLGFYGAEDKVAHAQGLYDQTFAAEGFDSGTHNLVEGIAEGNFEQMARGGAELVGATSQVVLVVAGAGEGLQRLAKPGKVKVSVESPAAPGATTRTLSNTSRGAPNLARQRVALKSRNTTGMTRAEKGVLGESRTAVTMTRAGFEELPARLSRNNGFDGVWVKRGADGKVSQIVVSESKFSSSGSASLSKTKNMGRQMSNKWVDENIRKMLESSDASVRRTAKTLKQNRDKVVRKVGVTDSGGNQSFNKVKLPE